MAALSGSSDELDEQSSLMEWNRLRSEEIDRKKTLANIKEGNRRLKCEIELLKQKLKEIESVPNKKMEYLVLKKEIEMMKRELSGNDAKRAK